MGRKKKKQYVVEDVTIVDTSSKGKGIGKKDGEVFFVHKAVPGDRINVRVTGKEKGVPTGLIDRMLERSPDRVKARCFHFGDCGGCKWQNLSYDKQLFYKEKMVRDTFKRIGHLEIEEERPIMGCELPYNYRNKVEFSFSNRQWVPGHVIKKGEPIDWYGAVGYHVAKFFDKVIDIENCHLHWPVIDEIRNEIRAYTRQRELTWYDLRMHTGYFRNMVFRTSEGTRELMLMMIVGEEDPTEVDGLFGHLADKFPQITSFVWMYNHKWNSTYSNLEPRIWKGPAYITEHLGRWKFRVSPTSFFQTNTHQARVLYDEVRKAIGEKVGTIYDLYCGAGSIGIYVSDLADKIVGIEYVESAVRDAYTNLELNGLDHLSFHAGNMKELLKDEFVDVHGRPDLVITDPPRNGMDQPVVQQLLQMRAPRIVYVSCNPATQARDLALLSEAYRVVYVQPVDMFPQTSHVENVAYLELKA
ncbi:MAG: 23S rRNA (uracil(1939)-C(5))-methyltransferase RlmD [Bacteroidota bacterium]